MNFASHYRLLIRTVIKRVEKCHQTLEYIIILRLDRFVNKLMWFINGFN